MPTGIDMTAVDLPAVTTPQPTLPAGPVLPPIPDGFLEPADYDAAGFNIAAQVDAYEATPAKVHPLTVAWRLPGMVPRQAEVNAVNPSDLGYYEKRPGAGVWYKAAPAQTS